MPNNKKEEMKKRENQKNNAFQIPVMGKISLWIDSYNDIFSDFDPRPFSQRALSIDFLDEAKRAARDKEEGLELDFLAPAAIRNVKIESMIKSRLKGHFRKHYEDELKKVKRIVNKGTGFVTAGIVLMFLATLILFKYAEKNFILTFLVILLEPAGWFTFWEGLDLIIFDSKKTKPELDFYQKMSKAKISFASY